MTLFSVEEYYMWCDHQEGWSEWDQQMGRMPQEAPEWDSSLPHPGETAGVVGIGIREEPHCRQDFSVTPEKTYVGPQG